MRFFTAALCTTVAAAFLASCSGNGSSPSSSAPGGGGSMPQGIKSTHHLEALTTAPKWLIHARQTHIIKAPASGVKGIASAEFFLTTANVSVFPKNNSANGPAVCTDSTGSNINDLASDSSGNLIVPDAFSGVYVYAPPFTSSSCGTLLGIITDSAGQASDAAAIDAATGTIVVGNIGGEVELCTLSSLSCTTATSPNMSTLAGVAMDKSGNCYADAFNTSGTVSLWTYSGTPSAPCTGSGTELGSANGFVEPYYGGLDVDNKGNLVVVSLFKNSSFALPSSITVYSGCATGTCTVVGGPFDANGSAEYVFGHVGRQNERFVAGNVFTGLDVYAYTGHGTGLTYMYSFSPTGCATNECEAAAYMPNAQR